MERLILNTLLKWKNSPYRKPLILKGVRQVGKTWILKEFGKRCYENTAYFNFDEHEEYKQFFETTKDVDRILQNLMLASGQKIMPEKTLIIFDEVQDCPKVMNSMKYFCENAPQYHVACAGSLLGIALAKPSSFPVGKVNFMQIDPMTFTEFLLANGDENLAAYLETVNTLEPIPDAFFNPLYEKLKMYYVTGGMPEPVKMWTEARDVEAMQEALSDILGAYERDFAKHPNVSEFPKISMIWKSIPSQLARENKKFLYKVVKEGARAREYVVEKTSKYLSKENISTLFQNIECIAENRVNDCQPIHSTKEAKISSPSLRHLAWNIGERLGVSRRDRAIFIKSSFPYELRNADIEYLEANLRVNIPCDIPIDVPDKGDFHFHNNT